jgi:hypothetical protein
MFTIFIQNPQEEGKKLSFLDAFNAFKTAAIYSKISSFNKLYERRWCKETSRMVNVEYYCVDGAIFTDCDFINPIFSVDEEHSSVLNYRNDIVRRIRFLNEVLTSKMIYEYDVEYIYSFSMNKILNIYTNMLTNSKILIPLTELKTNFDTLEKISNTFDNTDKFIFPYTFEESFILSYVKVKNEVQNAINSLNSKIISYLYGGIPSLF